jgi:hypothetical protein
MLVAVLLLALPARQQVLAQPLRPGTDSTAASGSQPLPRPAAMTPGDATSLLGLPSPVGPFGALRSALQRLAAGGSEQQGTAGEAARGVQILAYGDRYWTARHAWLACRRLRS